jgi:hypothetical protein
MQRKVKIKVTTKEQLEDDFGYADLNDMSA